MCILRVKVLDRHLPRPSTVWQRIFLLRSGWCVASPCDGRAQSILLIIICPREDVMEMDLENVMEILGAWAPSLCITSSSRLMRGQRSAPKLRPTKQHEAHCHHAGTHTMDWVEGGNRWADTNEN